MNPAAYRPTTWAEVKGQPTSDIKATINGHQTPNYLFYGPSGTGKDTVAYLIADELLPDRSELVEFNASDDRGIETVRETIIPSVDQTTLSGYPRVMYLNEMDSMTTDAQQALRQPMEQGNAIFILSANDYDAIHPALVSRCYEFEFEPLSKPAIKERLWEIVEQETLDVNEGQIESAASFSNGDMRKAIQHLGRPNEGSGTDEKIAQAARNFGD